MSLSLCVLASGSRGNSLYISDGRDAALVDIGLPYGLLRARAESRGLSLSGVSAVLNTHCHTDHCKGMGVFLNKHDVPVYSHTLGVQALSLAAGINPARIKAFTAGFSVGAIEVLPFLLSHDAPVCCGYTFRAGGRAISVATDLGTADESVLSRMYGSDIAVLECNHDRNMLLSGRYSPALKRRILSEKGHLGNDECAAAAERLLRFGTKTLVLAHLSEENNSPELAFSCVERRLRAQGATEGKDYRLYTASQHKTREPLTPEERP
jgi:phosphoribosyl 1,2-cyclic phosphodiesterase